MKYCPNCGAQLEDSAKFCTECGEKLERVNTSNNSEYTPQAEFIPQDSSKKDTAINVEPKKKRSGLSIAAFILSLTVALSPIAVILAIIDLIVNKRKKRIGLSVAALIIGVLFTVVLYRIGKGSSATASSSGASTSPTLANSTAKDVNATIPTEAHSKVPTSEPTSKPTSTPKPTPTPKPTAIPPSQFYGVWKSCGATASDGDYYTIKQLEDAGNYNITDFYYFLSESDATLYVQGEVYSGLAWHTTEDGIVVGSNQMTREKGKLSWKYDDEILWFERDTRTKSVEDIKKNPYVGATLEQINALKSAASYLNYSSFSYTGLIKQLEFEEFSHEAAVYAVDNCGADWFVQAEKSAASYLAYSSFSYKGLIKQLEFEGFTNEQAVHAVDNCGADWNEQAVKSAKSYIEYSSFSKNGLIKQLEFEGFTHEQAVYAVGEVGY